MPTQKQKNVLEIIAKHIESNGCSPTFAEIARGAGYSSVNSAVEVVAVLIKKGLLNKNGKGKMRNLTITTTGRAVLGLPIVKINSLMPCSIVAKYETLSPGMKKIVHELVEELHEIPI
tara:strand:- start:1624 stop:1977 length:354 start_codon:yes stop_codon:yes gene_type:complete